MTYTPREPHFNTPTRIIKGCVIQRINDDSYDEAYKWVCIAPKGHHINGYMTSYIATATLKDAEWHARHNVEEGEPE